MSPLLFVLSCVLSATPASATDDAPKQTAITYLKALTGTQEEQGKALLLGGATMNAQLFSLENWAFKGDATIQKEEGELNHAARAMKEIDAAGRTALTRLLGLSHPSQGDVQMTQVSRADAAALLEPTRERTAAFESSHPILAHALRVGKEVYWHPKNPMRAVLAQAGVQGRYSLEIHTWAIVTVEGPAKSKREWPLRVLRFRSERIDTGWKVLPASDWNAE